MAVPASTRLPTRTCTACVRSISVNGWRDARLFMRSNSGSPAPRCTSEKKYAGAGASITDMASKLTRGFGDRARLASLVAWLLLVVGCSSGGRREADDASRAAVDSGGLSSPARSSAADSVARTREEIAVLVRGMDHAIDTWDGPAYLAPFARSTAVWFVGQVGNLGLLFVQLLLTVVVVAILYSNGETAVRGGFVFRLHD